MKPEVFKTEFQARRSAKAYFASVLGVSPNSVHVEHDTFYESRGYSTHCVCGETRCDYFRMSNAGPKQQERLEQAIDRPGAVIAVGICECCGANY